MNAFFCFIPMLVSAALGAQSVSPQSGVQRPDRPGLQALRLRGLQDLDKGNILEADSLLSVADSAGALDALDMVKWMSAKAVLAKYYDAGMLCCRVAAKEPSLASIACTRLFEIVKDQVRRNQAPCAWRVQTVRFVAGSLQHAAGETMAFPHLWFS